MSPTARLNGVSYESEESRRYDKENLLWQVTVAIRLLTLLVPREFWCGSEYGRRYGYVYPFLRHGAVYYIDR